MFKKISVSTNKIHEDDSLGVLNHSTKLNPMCGKKTTHVKKSFDLLLLYLYNRFFLVLEVLYERSCSTIEAAQPCMPQSLISVPPPSLFFFSKNFQYTALIRSSSPTAYQGVRTVSFLENFASVLNE